MPTLNPTKKVVFTRGNKSAEVTLSIEYGLIIITGTPVPFARKQLGCYGLPFELTVAEQNKLEEAIGCMQTEYEDMLD